MFFTVEDYSPKFYGKLWDMSGEEVVKISGNPYKYFTPEMVEHVSYLTGRDEVEVYFACKVSGGVKVSASRLRRERAAKVLGLS